MEGSSGSEAEHRWVADRWRHPTGWRRGVGVALVLAAVAANGLIFWGYISHGPPPPQLDDQFGVLRVDGQMSVFSCVGEAGDGIHKVRLGPLDAPTAWEAVLDHGQAADVVPITAEVPGYRITVERGWTPTGVVQTDSFKGEKGSFSWYVDEFDTKLVDDGTAMTADGRLHTLTELGRHFPECQLPVASG